MGDASTTQMQRWIARVNSGDSSAIDELIEHSAERLRRLIRHIFRDFRRVRQFEDTDDVAQRASVRLIRLLRSRPPENVEQFLRFAACEIRRELIDLARHYYRPAGPGANLAAQPPSPEGSDSAYRPEPSDRTNEPERLAAWTEFHNQVEKLPVEERVVVELLWYQAIPQHEAAELLNISLATLKRRWMSARLRLQDLLRLEDLRT